MGKQKCKSVNNWIEYRLSFDEEARKIVASMSLTEKISLMSGRLTKEEIRSQILNKKRTHYNEKPYWAGGYAKKNVMPVLFVDGSRGVVCGKGKNTAFPVMSLRGATFDRELEEEIGKAIAEEILLEGGNLFGGVCLNLPYHPGWGRSQESYGEDSFLIGEMGAALVRGIQSMGVIACIKHYAFNSMENNRLSVNITCDKRTEQEVFLSHFKKCIDAGAGAVMTAYNSYLGEMCGENKYLLQHVLRDKWKFDGIVLSDFTWGIKDTYASASSGMDIEMPHTYFYGSALKKEVEDGRISEQEINQSAIRIVRTMLAHGNCILNHRDDNKERSNKSYKEHINLALKCALEGITLLENRDSLLPLRCTGKGKKIALLGLICEDENLGDHGSSRTYPPYVKYAYEGIWDNLSGAELIVYSGNNRAHCRRLAKEADAIIIIAGNSYIDEGEHIKADEDNSVNYGGDRVNGLSLPHNQREIIDSVSEIRKDSILVLTGGSAIIVDEIRERVGAILMQFYPGMEGGTALAQIIFGQVSPSGRLPFCIPRRDEDTVAIDFAANEQVYDRYHGYTFYDHEKPEPRYYFGHGLSYTEFEYSNLNVEIKEESLFINLYVKNIGSFEADRVILVFIGPPGVSVERERRLLKGFTRIHLQQDEQKNVSIECPLDELRYYDETTDEFVLEEGVYKIEAEGLEETVEVIL